MIWIAISLSPAFILGAALLWAMRARWWASPLYAVMMAVSLLGAADIMSNPKPIWAEWRDTSALPVVGVHYVPDVAIFVWAIRDGIPHGYVLPWSTKAAAQAQQVERSGLPMVMDYTEDQPPVFYAAPQPPSPPKPEGS